MRTIGTMAILAMLGACGGQPQAANTTSPEAAPTAEASVVNAPSPAPSPSPTASVVSQKTPALEFRYSYPAAAAAIPVLAASLDRAREALHRDADKGAHEDRQDAEKSDRPFNQHTAIVEWKVVTETPRFLSLSATAYQFTGGAHGNTGFEALLWDKRAQARLAPATMIDAAALQHAAGEAFCRALDAQRAKKRGVPVARLADEAFSDCPPVKDTTLILGSTDRRAIDRIGFLVDPYVAGPYAEGTYDVTLPVTPAILAAVKPAYRGAFAASTR